MAKLSELRTRIILKDSTQRTQVTQLGGDTERIRGTTLQNIRARHFSEFPLCVACTTRIPQRTTLATQLDHIIPIHQGGLDIPSNRQGLCDECHNEKTISERGDAPRKRKGGGA